MQGERQKYSKAADVSLGPLSNCPWLTTAIRRRGEARGLDVLRANGFRTPATTRAATIVHLQWPQVGACDMQKIMRTRSYRRGRAKIPLAVMLGRHLRAAHGQGDQQIRQVQLPLQQQRANALQLGPRPQAAAVPRAGSKEPPPWDPSWKYPYSTKSIPYQRPPMTPMGRRAWRPGAQLTGKGRSDVLTGPPRRRTAVREPKGTGMGRLQQPQWRTRKAKADDLQFTMAQAAAASTLPPGAKTVGCAFAPRPGARAIRARGAATYLRVRLRQPPPLLAASRKGKAARMDRRHPAAQATRCGR